MTSVVPFYMGHLLATHEVWPSLSVWVDTLHRASTTGLTTDEFAHAARRALSTDRDLLLSFLVVGPLFWLAALLLNDAHDVPSDRLNPRKADAPMVLGVITPRWALRASAVASVVTTLVALQVSVGLAVVSVMLLVGNYCYSTPPFRWKERPGADVLTNALGVGVLAPIGGWVIAKDLPGFPPEIALLGFLTVVALYIPTTLVDAEADLAAGYTTVATRFGPRRVYRVGLAAWVTANAGVIGLAATNTVFPDRLLSLHLVTGPLMVLEYVLLIGRPLTGLSVFRGLIVLSWTFLLVNADFALVYGGLWV